MPYKKEVKARAFVYTDLTLMAAIIYSSTPFLQGI